MEPITVTHDDPGNPLSVTVGEATALMGIKRTILISEALDSLGPRPKKSKKTKKAAGKEKVPTGQEWGIFLLRRYTWPVCIAAALHSEGFDYSALTFKEFSLMPERFVSAWEAAALRLNPHWKLQLTDQEEAEEKKDEGVSDSK